MRSALLYRYGDIAYWTGNYAEGGNDLIKAAALSAEAQSPTYHIRPAELTAARRADVDKSLEGYIRLNGIYRYQSGEQAFNGDKPILMREHRRPRKTLFRRVYDFFVEVAE